MKFRCLAVRTRTKRTHTADHPLIVQRNQLDEVTQKLVKELGPMRAGPAQLKVESKVSINAGDTTDSIKGKAQAQKIACLGWGSLIWKPGKLALQGPWLNDGPLVQVEFLRKSKDGRITLVLDDSAAPVQSRWALMNTPDIAQAVTSLREREEIRKKYEHRDIGVWQTGDDPPPLITGLPEWAVHHGVGAVIWTNLGHKFDAMTRPSKEDEVVEYLKGLTGQRRKVAEEYVRRAPRQVNTAYRRKIVEKLGWGCTED